MSHFIETLETRKLLSVSPSILADQRALTAEAAAIKTQAFALTTSIKAENKNLTSVVHALHVASNGPRLASLNHDEATGSTSVKKAGTALQKSESKTVAKVVADLRKLAAKPGNADLEAVLSVDILALTNNTTSTTTALATAFSNAVSLINADLNDIAVANSGSATVQAAVTVETNTLNADLAAVGAANTVLAGDVTQLLTDAG
jgi:hypothetical protein